MMTLKIRINCLKNYLETRTDWNLFNWMYIVRVKEELQWIAKFLVKLDGGVRKKNTGRETGLILKRNRFFP